MSLCNTFPHSLTYTYLWLMILYYSSYSCVACYGLTGYAHNEWWHEDNTRHFRTYIYWYLMSDPYRSYTIVAVGIFTKHFEWMKSSFCNINFFSFKVFLCLQFLSMQKSKQTCKQTNKQTVKLRWGSLGKRPNNFLIWSTTLSVYGK